ncbi:MAG TPA: O-antigen ligase domain-containing protein [Candidatus Portnoybacteria bacterium]|nr:O-antigen ligase domain-containing protein [Candidatus Portnoybacteria bacterium]
MVLFNFLYFSYLFVIFGVAFLSWPRFLVLMISGLFLGGFCFLSIKNKVKIFIRLIPFFVALPLTIHFDSLNLWRLASIIIFLQWFWLIRKDFWLKSKELFNFPKKNIIYFWQNYQIECLWGIIILISIFSIFKATYPLTSLRRIVYFLNLSLIYFPVKYLVNKEKENILTSFRADFLWAAGLVILIGFFQLMTSYFFSLDGFMKFWAAKVQLAFYGHNWSYIVRRLNTWFAYNFSSSLRLRMFSTFPDSHTFPLFLIISLPWLIWPRINVFYQKLSTSEESLLSRTKGFLKFKINWPIVFNFILILSFFIEIILSGTRGIWLGIMLGYLLLLLWWVKIRKNNNYRRFCLESSGIILIIFVISFIYTYLILGFPQFIHNENFSFSQGDGLIKRVGSMVNLQETSNSGRIFIWRETVESIVQNPFLGIGIFNFPIILRENISMTKAGATAHNLYLHIAAEIGLLGLFFSSWLFELILKHLVDLVKIKHKTSAGLFFLLLFAFIWILGYSLTDAAILDERIFLELAIVAGIVEGMRIKNFEF